MKRLLRARALAVTLLGAACSLPVHADSIASSASSAGSASSGSVSDSIQGSSHSSNGEQRVAGGQYRVLELAPAPGKPGRTRLTLHAQSDGTVRQFQLDVPDQALAGRAIAAGTVVQVNERPYGYEFALADTRTAFFLALHDDWYRELASRRVTL